MNDKKQHPTHLPLSNKTENNIKNSKKEGKYFAFFKEKKKKTPQKKRTLMTRL